MELPRQSQLVPLWEAVRYFSSETLARISVYCRQLESGVNAPAWAALIQTFNRMNSGAVVAFYRWEVRTTNLLLVQDGVALKKSQKNSSLKWLILNT